MAAPTEILTAEQSRVVRDNDPILSNRKPGIDLPALLNTYADLVKTEIDALQALAGDELTLANLTTTDKTSLVDAINEVDANADTAQAAVDAVEAQVGITVLANLTTTDKTGLQPAINEVDANADAAQAAVDAVEAQVGVTVLANLTTDDQTGLQPAINEVDANADAAQAAVDALEAQVELASENGTGVSISQVPGSSRVFVTFTNTPITLTDEAGVVAHGGLKILDLIPGLVVFLGAVADLAVTKSSAGVNDDWDGDWALGTVVASNNNTLSGTEADLIPSTATPQAVGGATTATGVSTATEAATVFDGTSSAVDVYLNFLVDDADHDVGATPCDLIVNGTVTLVYAMAWTL
jgi:hypothetical protein